jgi:adhesin/invasin
VTSDQAGSVKVTADVGGVTSSTELSFVADAFTATIISGDLTMLKNNAVADEITTNQVQVKVTDAKGNVVPNQTVAFAVDNNGIIVASAITNKDGIATATLKSRRQGASVVTATTNGHSQNVTATFMAYELNILLDKLPTYVIGTPVLLPTGYNQAKVTLQDGNWDKELYLSAKGAIKDDMISIISNATMSTSLDKQATNMSAALTITTGTTHVFIFNGTIWVKQ